MRVRLDLLLQLLPQVRLVLSIQPVQCYQQDQLVLDYPQVRLAPRPHSAQLVQAQCCRRQPGLLALLILLVL